MQTPPLRFSQLRWLHNAACVAVLIGASVLILLGLVGYGDRANLWMIAGGGLGLFLAVVQITVMPLLLKMESTVARQHGEIRDLNETLAKQSALLAAIVENTRISDAAKSLAHRDQEIEAFRSAIRDDIRMQKWEPALRLAEEMEVRFGYKRESDAIREELDEARNSAIQSKLSEAITVIDSHFKTHDWARAEIEIDRLVNALPDDTKVVSLFDRMTSLKEQHKRELTQDWDEAVRRSDVDRAIDTLKELDQYLSPAEAEVLQASARDVFKVKLLRLGVQFRFAVKEKRWSDALNSGLELVRDFPNARMATEVREALDTLRERARDGEQPTPA